MATSNFCERLSSSCCCSFFAQSLRSDEEKNDLNKLVEEGHRGRVERSRAQGVSKEECLETQHRHAAGRLDFILHLVQGILLFRNQLQQVHAEEQDLHVYIESKAALRVCKLRRKSNIILYHVPTETYVIIIWSSHFGPSCRCTTYHHVSICVATPSPNRIYTCTTACMSFTTGTV